MSVGFTEEMKGFYTPGAPAYDAGYVTGQRDWNRLMFHLTIETDDVGAVLRDPRHRMRARGFVRCRELGAADLPVGSGTFELFAPSTTPGRLVMRYRLPFESSRGPMTLLGFKDVGNDGGMDAWPDTTTLYTRLVHGIVEDFLQPTGEEYARGILRLGVLMFARQLTTFRGAPLDVGRFSVFFLARLLAVYGRRPRIEVRP
jgi:cholesterol oxidase